VNGMGMGAWDPDNVPTQDEVMKAEVDEALRLDAKARVVAARHDLRVAAREQIARALAGAGVLSPQVHNPEFLARVVLAEPAMRAVFDRAARYDAIETDIEAELGQLREIVHQVRKLAERLERGHWRDADSYAKAIRQALGDTP
jgi:hypothetical protein